jgi:hypothetical protein
MRAASLTRLVIAAAVAGSTLALPANAAAQFRDRDRDDRGWNIRDRSEGYQRGFQDGERLGEQDARNRRGFNVQNHREYREADAGYQRANGSRDLYRDEFRRGFTEGYRLGYRDDRVDRRDDRNGRDRNRGWNGGGFRDPGQARGFSDGYRRGIDDRRDNRRFEPNRFKEVRQGTAPGYEGNFGSRERYTMRYRDGFREGYEDGFRSANARR